MTLLVFCACALGYEDVGNLKFQGPVLDANRPWGLSNSRYSNLLQWERCSL